MSNPATFRHEIEQAINRCSKENGSNTPDWILANFLLGALEAFDAAVIQRETWYGRCGGPDKLPLQGPGSSSRLEGSAKGEK